MMYPDSWMLTLPAMLTGMAGIFLVIAVIMGSLYLLNYLSGRKK